MGRPTKRVSIAKQAYQIALAMLLCVATQVGCGKQGPAIAPVHGRITYRGKPVAGALVTFLPADPNAQPAIGLTNDEGTYRLGTLQATDGALVGDHVVTVVAQEKQDAKVPAGKGAAYLEELQSRAPPRIPSKYFSAKTSGLTAEVRPRKNEIDFALAD